MIRYGHQSQKSLSLLFCESNKGCHIEMGQTEKEMLSGLKFDELKGKNDPESVKM